MPDLSGYFDSIPHPELLKFGLHDAISDRHVLRLIKMWLEAPVGRDRRSWTFTIETTRKQRTKRRGCPQGTPVVGLCSQTSTCVGFYPGAWKKRLGHQAASWCPNRQLCR